MAKKPRRKPVWWRDIEKNEAAMVARVYIAAQNDVASAIPILSYPEPLADKDMTIALEDQVRLRLLDGPGWFGTPNPPPLHAAVYVTRAFGEEKLRSAVTALAWLELVCLYFSGEGLPLSPLVAAVENLPANAEVDQLVATLADTAKRGLANANPTDAAPSGTGIVVLTLDLWIRRLIGKGIDEFLNPHDFVIGTGQLLGHQNSFLSRKHARELSGELNDRRSNHVQKYRARSWVDVPSNVEIPSSELLKEIYATLLKRKENAASLLKTHLYLVDQARSKGGPDPLFTVHLDDLLEAKGYKRRADGAFHPETYREEWGRLETLASCWLEVRRVNEKNRRGKTEVYIDEAPYWQIEARRRLADFEALGEQQQPAMFGDLYGPIVKSVLIRPGAWWRLSDIGDKFINVPREILALPIDGNGNAKERMAVQIAAVLALWVRSSQKTHAGDTTSYSVGKLLETAGIVTYDDFEKMHNESARRIREQLAGENKMDEPVGAIHILGKLGAFTVNVKDADNFWAGSRGWKARFWDAKLVVQVPNLSIAKAKS